MSKCPAEVFAPSQSMTERGKTHHYDHAGVEEYYEDERMSLTASEIMLFRKLLVDEDPEYPDPPSE
jgi:hypothetical protein